ARPSPVTPFLPTTPPRHPCSPLFPYTTLFRSSLGGNLTILSGKGGGRRRWGGGRIRCGCQRPVFDSMRRWLCRRTLEWGRGQVRSEEHTSELQSLAYLVCRLLLEKKNALELRS